MDDPVVSIHNAIIRFRNGKYLLLYKELKGFSIVAIIVTLTRHLLQILNYSYWSFMSFPGMKRDIPVTLQACLGKEGCFALHKVAEA